MHALVTGGAGFIGSNLVDRLLAEGWRVTCVDNFDPFYDRSLKEDNIKAHRDHREYRLVEEDIRNLEGLRTALTDDYDVIFHLAAKAGVRPSIQDPITYQQVNIGGTQNLLEFAKERRIPRFIFASSSSVYGVNPRVPWKEDDGVLMPISPYAATKVAGELLGHTYSHLYGIRFIALRLFTVYGPRQRPDLAIHKLARLMLAACPVPIYGDGSSSRDYTYIDDIINGIVRAAAHTGASYDVINLGSDRPISLLEVVAGLEEVLGVKGKREFHPEQPGDVPRTWADIRKAGAILGYRPTTPFLVGLQAFATWLRAADSARRPR